jgi:peptidoglycan/xylan/chitin deacetylase (PgdA/CDA1 family)
VGEAIQYPARPAVCITFDDGCETDLVAAAPLLSELNFHATFYLTAGFIGSPGYLSVAQARQLHSFGFEIGCHSMTHPYLSDLPDAQLQHEIVDAKAKIEQVIGHAIDHFSCPGGRYDQRTLETARRAGFRTVATSRFHANTDRTDYYQLGRVAMLRAAPLEQFAETCHGRGLWQLRMRDRVRHGVQRILGNRGYDRLRSAVLGSRNS